MARFYADENFPLAVVRLLRDLDHDVLTAHEVGQSNRRIPDPEVLAFAVARQRAVLTLNRRHFARLHEQQGGQHHGILLCTDNPDREDFAERIHAAVKGVSLEGRLLRITRPG